MKKFVAVMIACSTLAACAGGAEEASKMPTPVLCKTVMDLSPGYIRYNEYLDELKKRNTDCSKFVGSTNNIRVR